MIELLEKFMKSFYADIYWRSHEIIFERTDGENPERIFELLYKKTSGFISEGDTFINNVPLWGGRGSKSMIWQISEVLCKTCPIGWRGLKWTIFEDLINGILKRSMEYFWRFSIKILGKFVEELKAFLKKIILNIRRNFYRNKW